MKAYTALLALASAVNAHMIMKSPVPAGSPNSSPLSADGSDFPCKTGGGALDKSNPNVMSVGSSNTLSFTGSATHGGGSCQVSLAKGTDLSASTKWMVIHSIEGGCPAPNNGNQNLGNDPNGSGASQFQFTIPDHPDLGPGDYTLAWTWNNRIGNREFYMNCAYVQLSGAAKKRYAPSKPAISKRQSSSLPDMFVANIGNGCTTAEGIDVEYPNPGSSVEIGPGANLGKPSGSCGSVGAAPANPGGNSPTTPSSSAFAGNPGASNTVAPVQPSATGGFATGNPGGQPSSSAGGFGGNPNNGQYTQSAGNGGNGFATVTGGGAGATGSPNNGQFSQSVPNVFATGASPSAPAVSATSAVAQEPTAPAATAPSAPEPTTPAPPIGTGTTSPTGGEPSGSCSDDGAWQCLQGNQLYRCASGRWQSLGNLAAGMSCGGIGPDLEMVVSSGNAKRDLRSHIARRRHNLHGSFLS